MATRNSDGTEMARVITKYFEQHFVMYETIHMTGYLDFCMFIITIYSDSAHVNVTSLAARLCIHPLAGIIM